jgi:putative acetyltransferase
MERSVKMIVIRPEQKEDIERIKEINDLAFNGLNESKLIAGVRDSEYFIPELSLVAVNENQVIGHILFSIISIETEDGHVPTIGLAPMAVHPDFQNQGIGSYLVSEGIQRCKGLNYEHVFVLGHPNFYPKFGFIPSTVKGIRSPFPVPDEVFMVNEIREGSLTDISGKIVYPPAFDSVS